MKIKPLVLIVICISTSSYAKDPSVQLADLLINNLVPISEGFQHLQLGPIKLGPNGGNNIMGGGSLIVSTKKGAISSKDIEMLYTSVCEKLSSQYGDNVVTYRYKLPRGESAQTTIVQFDFGLRRQFYLLADIAEGMDIDGKVNGVGLVFHRVQGLYERSEDSKQSGWTLGDYLQKVE